VIVMADSHMVRRLCTMAAVLEGGELIFYDDIEAALEHHDENLEVHKSG